MRFRLEVPSTFWSKISLEQKLAFFTIPRSFELNSTSRASFLKLFKAWRHLNLWIVLLLLWSIFEGQAEEEGPQKWRRQGQKDTRRVQCCGREGNRAFQGERRAKDAKKSSTIRTEHGIEVTGDFCGRITGVSLILILWVKQQQVFQEEWMSRKGGRLQSRERATWNKYCWGSQFVQSLERKLLVEKDKWKV